MQALRVNIIGKSNGVGLTRDLSLLADVIKQLGHAVVVTRIDGAQARRRRSILVQWARRVKLALDKLKILAPRSPIADVNIMLEHVWSQYLRSATANVVVPNPEWFDAHDCRFVHHPDRIWAKTRYTTELFRSLGCEVTFVGFDSEDRYDEAVPRQRTFFHLAGKSSMKGTDRLLRVWARHPQWPRLTVVQHSRESHAADITAPNIDRRVGYLEDGELRSLQNAALFHVCTSLTEGWGHYIVEALSVSAITVTVDAAPMNELVTKDRGILVPYSATGMQRLATTYLFDEMQLERAIERALSLTELQCRNLSSNARCWFLQNKQQFPVRLQNAVEELLQGYKTLPIQVPR